MQSMHMVLIRVDHAHIALEADAMIVVELVWSSYATRALGAFLQSSQNMVGSLVNNWRMYATLALNLLITYICHYVAVNCCNEHKTNAYVCLLHIPVS